MSVTLDDATVIEIAHLLGIREKNYTEIYLTDLEIEKLYELSKSQKNKMEKIKIRTNCSGGFGINICATIDNQEIDITDYDAW